MDKLSKLDKGNVKNPPKNKFGTQFKKSKSLPPILEDDGEAIAALDYRHAMPNLSLSEHFQNLSMDGFDEEEGAAAAVDQAAGVFDPGNEDFLDDEALDMNLGFEIPAADHFAIREFDLLAPTLRARRRRRRHSKKM